MGGRGGLAARGPANKNVARQASLKNFRKVQEVYDFKGVLGMGGCAVVWRAVHKETKREFAIKAMKIADPSSDPNEHESTLEEIDNEIQVLRRLGHPNIVHVEEYFTQDGKFYIVMTLLDGGELLDALLNLGYYTVSVSEPRPGVRRDRRPAALVETSV